MWPSWNFPIQTCFVHDYCAPGAYAHRAKLERDQSPMLRSPFERGETFVRSFADAFTVARMKGYAAILHTGSVGRDDPNSGRFHFSGPLGFGGGQLSAFWTPATGSVILGRRRGMQWEKSFDKVEEWRLWPIHAVSGTKADGKLFTSALTTTPQVKTETGGEGTVVRVSGRMLPESLGQGKVLEGRIEYQRVFTLEAESVQVRTQVTSSGQDTISELYETIPVFLRDPKQQPKAKPTAIEFAIGDKSAPATAEWQAGVTSVRLSRFGGAARIVFERPQRVKLSDQDWKDTLMTRVGCRNILIDLLDNAGEPEVMRAAEVGYRIGPE